jgi:hypothetical protein
MRGGAQGGRRAAGRCAKYVRKVGGVWASDLCMSARGSVFAGS